MSRIFINSLIFGLAITLMGSINAQEIGRYPLHQAANRESAQYLNRQLQAEVNIDQLSSIDTGQVWESNFLESEPAQATKQRATSDPRVRPDALDRANIQEPIRSSTTQDSDFFAIESREPFQLSTGLKLPTVQPIFATPANRTPDGANLLSTYQSRPEFFRDVEQVQKVEAIELASIPNGFRTWWMNPIGAPMGISRGHTKVSINSLIQSALRHSPHVQVAATQPHIRQTSVFEEASQFDWSSFVETKYDDSNDPIGNSLTTGNNENRFKQQEWYGRGGVRRKNSNGGELELSQRLGHLDNNSRFLIPRDQGSSRLELNYRQPLLNGRGQAVNESLILLADIDFRSASDDFLDQLQLHLVGVAESYWELVRSRAAYSQRRKLLHDAEAILGNLTGRADVDALDRQIYRAKAAVANRRAEIARSLTSIKNSESRLRLLVNDPAMISSTGSEFIPTDIPSLEPLPIELADALSTALANRPDISKAIRDLRAANVRLGVAKNDILPQLDLLVGTYVAGLDGDSDVFESWTRQFKDGGPGFNVGLEFEVPIGNRAAHARQQRREWELTRALNQFRAVVETSLTEVELAVREVTTTHKELLGHYHAMVAAENETAFLVDRWQTLPDIDDSVTLLLEDLLDSQERLADEEAAFAQAQMDYSVAAVKLKQVMGTLFQVNH